MADADPHPPGPFKHQQAFGREIPLYLLTFDAAGQCTSPKTAEQLIGTLEEGKAKDVLLYSHGWNNDFPTAEKRYDSFLAHLSAVVAAHAKTAFEQFDPVFVGVIWPSTALTFGDERPPDIAATATAKTSDELGELEPLLLSAGEDELAAKLGEGKPINKEEAARLAAALAPMIAGADVEVTAEQPAADDLLRLWASPAGEQTGVTGSFAEFGTGAAAPGEAQPAGILDYFDPRWIVRTATVLMMKSRAGVVGAGLGETIRSILKQDRVRLWMVGHSYGAKVILSALAVQDVPRPAEGVMLLQPAISALCFAPDVGDGRPGGFRKVLARVRNPIFTTFSKRDIPLHDLFHLIARRSSDLGELQTLAGASRFAALGGYGPQECAAGECETVKLVSPPTALPAIPAGVRVVALNGDDSIPGHGEVHGEAVMWAMSQLLERG